MIYLKLQFGKDLKRKTFWKFNSSLLKDKQYIEEVNAEIQKVIEEYGKYDTKYPTIHDIPLSELKFQIPDKIFLDFKN